MDKMKKKLLKLFLLVLFSVLGFLRVIKSEIIFISLAQDFLSPQSTT